MPASSEVTLNHWHVLGTIISLLCISLEMLLILKRGWWETKTAGYVSLPVQWETPWDSRLCCGQCYHLDVMRIDIISIQLSCLFSSLDNRTNLKSFALWDGVEQRGLCRHLTPECHILQSQSEKLNISHVTVIALPVSSCASQVEMPVDQIHVTISGVRYWISTWEPPCLSPSVTCLRWCQAGWTLSPFDPCSVNEGL